jgi:rRNA maturation RNase YbeY
MPSSPEIIIQFYFLKKMESLRDRVGLKSFLTQLFKKEKRKLIRLNYIFCSDSYLLNINKKYLSHNYFTDIITFPFSEPAQPIVADIYISVDRIRENAATFRTSIKQELHRVIFHGALHLCGYNDKSKSEASEMRKKENTYLSLYLDHFVPRETIN